MKGTWVGICAAWKEVTVEGLALWHFPPYGFTLAKKKRKSKNNNNNNSKNKNYDIIKGKIVSDYIDYID